MRRFFLALAAMLLAATAVAFEPSDGGVFAERVIAITDEVAAPDTILDLPNDETTTLAAFRGQVTIVPIWATWCHVCELEMPIIDSLAEDWAAKGVTLAPVSVDEAPAIDLIADHIAAHKLRNFTVMHDRDWALAGRVGLRGTPTTLIVDKFSQIVAAFEGQAPWTDPALNAYLAKLVKADDPVSSRNLLQSP